MTCNTLKNASALLGAAALTLAALPAVAQTGLSDSFTVFDPSGGVFAQINATEDATESPAGNYFIPNLPNLILADPNQFGKATSLFEQGGTAANGPYSDIFGVANIGGAYVLAFNSDGDPAPAAFGGFGATVLSEGAGTFNATIYLDPTLRTEGYTATFFSDVSAPDAGATGLLLGIALGGLALLRRKLS